MAVQIQEVTFMPKLADRLSAMSTTMMLLEEKMEVWHKKQEELELELQSIKDKEEVLKAMQAC